MQKLERILEQMTLEEKVSQLISIPYDRFYDMKDKKLLPEAGEVLKNGIGHVGRVGGSNDNYPVEVAKATNDIQKCVIQSSRFGIPALFITEATSGVLGREFTLFPGNLNVGAMFCEEINEEIGNAIREEMCAVGERMALAPVVDIIRDHRYGRYEESYSEDVYLATQNGMSYVSGMQGGNLKTGIATTLKHYVAQGISDGGKNCAPVHLAERELLDEYVIPFEACIKKADAAALMAAYHELDGIPCHASKELIVKILREKIGFQGLVMSDGNGIQLIKDFQEYTENYADAAKVAMQSGIELEHGVAYQLHLAELVRNHEVREEDLNSAVLRVLQLKKKLGLFENPYVDEKQVKEIVQNSKHLDLSYRAAKESIVLLKNKNNILPLKSKMYSKIAVVGPLADRKAYAYGDYSYPTHIMEMFYNVDKLTEEEIVARTIFSNTKNSKYEDLFHNTKTVYEVLKEEYTDSKVIYCPGLKDTYNHSGCTDFKMFDEMKAQCADADLILAVLGDTSGMGLDNDTGESVDRVDITLGDDQRALLQEIKTLGKPIILILGNGRPVELSMETELCDAIIECFRLGQRGSEAIADVLSGRHNPSGRLPVTIPKHQGQLPVYYSQRITGHKQFWREKYLEMDLNPLYEFGYGLSYTNYNYQLVDYQFKADRISFTFTVENTGSMDGQETAQVYVSKKYASVSQPKLELKAYKKVLIKAGEKKQLSCELFLDTMVYHNCDGKLCLDAREIEVLIGKSCLDIQCKFSVRLDNIYIVNEREFTNSITVL